MKKAVKTEYSRYGKMSREFMRKMTMRFARGNARLMLGYYLDKEDIEKMRKEVLAHDFTHISRIQKRKIFLERAVAVTIVVLAIAAVAGLIINWFR